MFLFQEGTANYLKGLMLILCYLIVAASFFVHVDPTTSKSLENSSLKKKIKKCYGSKKPFNKYFPMELKALTFFFFPDVLLCYGTIALWVEFKSRVNVAGGDWTWSEVASSLLLASDPDIYASWSAEQYNFLVTCTAWQRKLPAITFTTPKCNCFNTAKFKLLMPMAAKVAGVYVVIISPDSSPIAIDRLPWKTSLDLCSCMLYFKFLFKNVLYDRLYISLVECEWWLFAR